MWLGAWLKPRTNLTKSTEKEKTGEAYHRTPCGRSSIVEERSESKLGFPTHALESKHLQRQTKAKHTCAHRSQDHWFNLLVLAAVQCCTACLLSSWAFHKGRCLCSESVLGAPPKNLRKISSKGQGKTSTQGGTIEHKMHTQMNRIKIPEDTRREGPPFPRIQGTSSSNQYKFFKSPW